MERLLFLAASKALVVSCAKIMGARSIWSREVVAHGVNLIRRCDGRQFGVSRVYVCMSS